MQSESFAASVFEGRLHPLTIVFGFVEGGARDHSPRAFVAVQR